MCVCVYLCVLYINNIFLLTGLIAFFSSETCVGVLGAATAIWWQARIIAVCDLMVTKMPTLDLHGLHWQQGTRRAWRVSDEGALVK